jgi:hypothetical protein
MFAAHACDVEHVCPIRSPIETLRLELWKLLARTNLRDLTQHPLPLRAAAGGPRS